VILGHLTAWALRPIRERAPMKRRNRRDARRAAVTLALLGALAFGMGGPWRIARADAPVPVRIGLFASDVGADVYYADELGYFAKAGIAPEIIDLGNGGAIASAVAGGSVDIGTTNVVSLALAHSRGLPFRVLAGGGLSLAGVQTNGLLAVAASSPIRTAKDLIGKTVAVDVLGGIPELGVRAWLDSSGGDSKRVKIIELHFAEMIAAVQSGRVDAALVNASVDSTIGKPGDPLRLLAVVYDAIAPRFASSIWFSTADWIAQHPEAAKGFATALGQAATWANAHHHESAIILAKHIKQTAAQIDGGPRVVYDAAKDPALLQPVIDAAAKYGEIPVPFPARDVMAP
jgi:NitT/TauT family transport system substrate-binding protein